MPTKIAKIPITNIFMGGDYTGQVFIGGGKKPLNVILDTGSSTLALDAHKYTPDTTGGDQLTNIAQEVVYGSGSWAGAVIKCSVAIGSGANQVSCDGVSTAIAYHQSHSMFGNADGILGLAYAALDDAYQMPGSTWQKKYSMNQIRSGKHGTIVPYLTQLAGSGVVSDKFAFYTLRSYVHAGNGPNDPLNQGWMIVGGGEESTDLYAPPFQTVKVLSDDWYSTNLKQIIVGNSAPIAVPGPQPGGMPTNCIVDSGTNSIRLGTGLLGALLNKLTASQKALLTKAIQGQPVAVSDLQLAAWPDLTFVQQGESGDVALKVTPATYWQVNSPAVGQALTALLPGDDGAAILGLPLLNNYFTIFDGEADGGKGAIMFAAIKPPSS